MKKNILFLYENENLKRGGQKKKIMSLCENEKNQKGGRTENKERVTGTRRKAISM
jgi:hypothetical protein